MDSWRMDECVGDGSTNGWMNGSVGRWMDIECLTDEAGPDITRNTTCEVFRLWSS